MSFLDLVNKHWEDIKLLVKRLLDMLEQVLTGKEPTDEGEGEDAE